MALVLFGAYLGLATLIGVPAFSKHTAQPAPFVLGYAAVLLFGGIALARAPATFENCRRYFRWSWLLFGLALAGLNAALYPGTRTTAARSSAPDALIDPALRLLSGIYPYADVLFDGAPISPGPAWIAAHAPLTAVGLIWLVVPVHLALATYMMCRRSPLLGAAFPVLTLALPPFLQMSFVGHDLFAVGCALVTITLGINEQLSRRTRTWVLWSIGAGIVATARAPLIVFVFSLGLLIARDNSRLAVRFLAVAGLVALGTHALVWSWGHTLGLAFQPLHVFGRAGGSGTLAIAIGALISLATAAYAWKDTSHPSQWLFFAWATTGLPFVAVGVGELIIVNRMDWANWEGKVYAGFGLPLLIGAMLLHWRDARACDVRLLRL
jgi:hypothetical protein